MISVFYDLETTDRNTIGQIINYCFIAVDGDFNPVKELYGTVSISRLQLPMPDAILANNTDVLEHQQNASHTEREASKAIFSFLSELTRSKNKVPLIGYNSNRFDLKYLRTTLIRNGINPYFGGRLVYHDLLHAARKLACTHKEFTFPTTDSGQQPLACRDKFSQHIEPKRTLALEALCQEFGLLDAAQEHESRADVLLTIALAKFFVNRFNLDVRTFTAYEPRLVPELKPGAILGALKFCYDGNAAERATCVPVMLLSESRGAALWVDLAQYREGEGRESVYWHNPATHQLQIDPEFTPSEHDHVVAREALQELRAVTPDKFFERSTCDIEQDIYRLDFQDIDTLHAALWRGSPNEVQLGKKADLKNVFLRWQLANYSWGEGNDERMRMLLARYARYRYGGKLQLARQIKPEVAEEEEVNGNNANSAGSFHMTVSDILGRMEEIEGGGDESQPTDSAKRLLKSLREFYARSEICEAAPELFDKCNAEGPVAAINCLLE